MWDIVKMFVYSFHVDLSLFFLSCLVNSLAGYLAEGVWLQAHSRLIQCATFASFPASLDKFNLEFGEIIFGIKEKYNLVFGKILFGLAEATQYSCRWRECASLDKY